MVETISSRNHFNRRRLLQAGAATAAGAHALSPAVARAAPPPSRWESPAMRRADLPVPLITKAPPPTPPPAVIALNRMGFGPRPGDIAAFFALGSTGEERIQAYVAQQLDPAAIPDTELANRLAAAGFESLYLSSDPDVYLATLWDWYINDNAPSGNTSSSVPRDELTRAAFLRAMYSKKQFVEVLAAFWHDHFNVHADKSSVTRATLPHLDMVLRIHLLGNFRVMLEAVGRSPAMLYYLDNYTSSNSGPNENYCRELFELHTLGAENYLGILPQSQVPQDGGGRPVGYVDADVFEATRCFTGWSFSHGHDGDGDTGLFYYRPSWHDRFQKTVLGVFIPQDQTDLKDGRDVFDALASHPGTGRHIARKLCRRLIADDPPQSVVDAAAAVFTAAWQAPDQLKQVYEVILLSDEFLATWGEKVKRPFEIAVSALRATAADFTPKRQDSDTDSFLWRYDSAGQRLFDWPAPNGYPDLRDAWQRMIPRIMSWRLCGWLVDFENDDDVHYLDLLGQTPAGARSANELADFWINRILGRSMAAEDREEVVRFMAQGFNPDFELDLTDKDTCDRLRSMVALILMSPDFLWR